MHKIFLSKIYKHIVVIYNNLKTKIILIFKKQSTLKSIYSPIIQEKTKENNMLIYKLKKIKKINSEIEKEIKTIKLENIELQNKIKILQELIINK